MAVKPQFMIERQGKRFVLYEGLLDAAHEDGLSAIATTLLQIPNDANGQVAIVQAVATTTRGSFSGIGDASPQNVAPAIRTAIIRMAETRAKARALRDAINVGVTAFEELGTDGPDTDDDERDDSGPPITGPQLKALYAIARNEAHLEEPALVAAILSRYAVPPEELTKRQASTVIDDLKSGKYTVVDQYRGTPPPDDNDYHARIDAATEAKRINDRLAAKHDQAPATPTLPPTDTPRTWRDRIQHKYFATAKGTPFATDEGRHAFITRYTQGRQQTLSQFLAVTTEADGNALILELERSIAATKPRSTAETNRVQFRANARERSDTPVSAAHLQRLGSRFLEKTGEDTLLARTLRYLFEDGTFIPENLAVGEYEELLALLDRPTALKPILDAAREEYPDPIAEPAASESESEPVPF